jgi:hypothetical protein
MIIYEHSSRWPIYGLLKRVGMRSESRGTARYIFSLRCRINNRILNQKRFFFVLSILDTQTRKKGMILNLMRGA